MFSDAVARTLPAALLLSLALATAAPAAAAPSTVARFVPAGVPSTHSGPVLAGNAAAWARHLPAGGWAVERGSPGSDVERVALSGRPDATVHELRMVGGSSTRIAWLDYGYSVVGNKTYVTHVRRRQLMTSGSTAAVAGCGGQMPPCECPPYCGFNDDPLGGDLDGDVLAYLEGYYTGDRRIVVDDLASPADPLRIDPDRLVDYVRIAGDHVAWLERTLTADPQSWTVVWNWREGREVLRLHRRELLDVQADGKIVVAGPGRGLTWFAPGDPDPHVIQAPANHTYSGVRLARDRLLFVDALDTAYEGGPPIALVTSDLAGNTQAVGAGGTAPDELSRAGVDFDGRRAAWTTRACGLVSVRFDDDVTAPRGDFAPPPPCTPPSIAKIGSTSGDRIAVHVRCKRGCKGLVGLYDTSSPRRGRIARASVDLRRAGSRRVLLTPSAAYLKQRRPNTKKVRVQAIFDGRDGRGLRVGAVALGSVRRP